MRAYVPQEDWDETEVTLSAEESHHVRDVLRSKVGEQVEIFDGCGRVATGEIVSSAKRAVSLRVMDTKQVVPPAVSLTLIQALPKGHKIDLIIQKAVELGIDCIMPIQTQHCVSKLDSKRAASKVERWHAIAINAAKQCGSAWIPDIPGVQTLEEIVDEFPDLGTVLMGDIASGTRPLKDVLAELQAERVAAVIGPEGDLSEEEKNLLRAKGALSVGFGDQVLRTETAALYIMSVLHYAFR